MKMYTLKLALGLCLIGGLSACAQTPKTPVSAAVNCDIPQQNKLADALVSAQNVLGHRSCHYQFETIHQQLIEVAKNDANPENKFKFLSFYKWSVNNGIINSRQSKQRFNRYFSTSFAHVLNNEQRTCSMAAKKDELFNQLKRELPYKKTGLLDVMGDVKAYHKAQGSYNDLKFLVNTTWLACENS